MTEQVNEDGYYYFYKNIMNMNFKVVYYCTENQFLFPVRFNKFKLPTLFS
jgi:hypothetical protein